MADNVTTDDGVIATDEVGGAHYQRVKVVAGADGSATDVTIGGGVEAAALRVTIASDSTGVLSVDDNGGSLTVDNAALSVTGGGVEASAVRVTIANDSTGVLSVDDNGGSLTVDGTVAVTNAHLTSLGGAISGTEVQVDIVGALPAGTAAIGKLAANSGVDIGDVDVTTCGTITPGTAASSLGKAEDAAHSSGDVGVFVLAVRNDGEDNLVSASGDYAPLQVNSDGNLVCAVNNTVGVSGAVTVSGDIAHDAADSGNPVKIGGKARTTNPTATADADRVDATFDDIGRQVVVLNQVRDLVGSQVTTISNSTSETTVVTAIASTFCDLTSLTITNATATAVVATLKDATAGTTRGIYAIAASGGVTIPFPVPKPQAAVNNNWTITLSALSITVYVVAEYVKNV